MSLSKSLSTNSTQSFDSFASDDESAESTPKTYDMAPWDIFTEHPMVGKVCVATKGEVVPKETRYGVKFRYCIFQDFLRIYLFSVLMNILL